MNIMSIFTKQFYQYQKLKYLYRLIFIMIKKEVTN